MKALLLLLLAIPSRALILPAPVEIIKSTPIVVIQGTNPWNITGSTIIVTVASDITLTTSTAQIGSVYYSSSTYPTISTATVSSTDVEVLAANPSRKALECRTGCTANVTLNYKFNSDASVAPFQTIEACNSWQPPPGVAFNGSLHFYAPSGSQVVRCTEYP